MDDWIMLSKMLSNKVFLPQTGFYDDFFISDFY